MEPEAISRRKTGIFINKWNLNSTLLSYQWAKQIPREIMFLETMRTETTEAKRCSRTTGSAHQNDTQTAPGRTPQNQTLSVRRKEMIKDGRGK
jgi:hypothetical protein